MDDRRETLECLIGNRAFAPSKAAFARDVLKQAGRMGLYRLGRATANARLVDAVWNAVLDEFGLADSDLYDMRRAFKALNEHYAALDAEIADHEARAEYMVALLADGRFDTCSPGFNAATAPRLNDLRAGHPDAYWAFVTLVYFRARGIDAYRYISRGEAPRLIGMVDRVMMAVRPERAGVHAMVESLCRQGAWPALWNVVHCCATLLRAYCDSGFTAAAAGVMRLLGLGGHSFWRTPGTPYGEGSEVWLLDELPQGSHGGGHYFAIRLRAGCDIRTFATEGALMLGFWATDGANSLPVAQAYLGECRGHESDFYLYGYNSGRRELSLEPVETAGLGPALPATLQMIDTDCPRGADEKVWARVLCEWYAGRGEEACRTAREHFSGWADMDGTYRVADVVVSKAGLTLRIDGPQGLTDYSLPAGSYAFISGLSPSQPVSVACHRADGELYAVWPDIGCRIRLGEFTARRAGG